MACFFLAVEVQGVEYPKNRQGGPILPAFKTAEFSRDLLDAIYNELPEGEICLTNGPVFCDYDISDGEMDDAAAAEPLPVAESVPQDSPAGDKMRLWSFRGGHTLEAKFINIFGGKVVLKDGEGKVYKIALEQLLAADLEYAELAGPPAFEINFLNNFNQKTFSGGFYDVAEWERPAEERGHYGMQIKQTSAGEYNHELQVEMFVIGKQRSRPDAKYILLDRQAIRFNPAEQDRRYFEFRSPREVVLNHYSIKYYETEHGEKYAGYLVTVTDKRGEIIVVESSNNWLFENLKNLKNLSVGNYMDKTCMRTFPSRPKSPHY